VLSSALSRSLEALDGFRSALAGKPVTDARWHRLASLDRLCRLMDEFPTILLIQGRTQHFWMDEEINARMTEDFIATVDAVGEIYFQSSHSPKMTDIGIVWFVAKEIVEAWQNKQTSPPGSA